MNQGQSRIACPRCRANNFLGTPNCWQCGASLPPPEAIAQAAAMPSPLPSQAGQAVYPTAQYPASAPQYPAPNNGQVPGYYLPSYAIAPPHRGSKWFLILPAFMLLAMILTGLFFVAFRSRSNSLAPGLGDAQQQMNAYADRLRREMNGSPDSSDTDPVIAQGRREIERLSQQTGGYAPPTDPQGNVHLRTGGTITREQWDRAAGSVGR